MKFLIPTTPDDIDSIFVKVALEEMGHDVMLMFTADQPTLQKNSVFVDKVSYSWQSKSSHNTLANRDYDVVWWRRPRRPFVPMDLAHPDDRKFVVRENVLFFDSFTENMAPHAWWINPKEAAHRANFKLLQLKLASECGFVIPTTLCSNDPNEIRRFLSEHEQKGVIYKPMSPQFWVEAEQAKITYTSRVKALDLPNDASLQRVPGLFQIEVNKQYELRIVCFGDHLVAAKLNSQDCEEGMVDWRAIRKGGMSIEPYVLPEVVATKIRALMRELDIAFGSIDMIVTPEGEYVFLEVNEQGQFLWLEEYNPAFYMLDTFVNFMIHGSRLFEWVPQAWSHRLEDYRDKVQLIYQENYHEHVSFRIPEFRQL